MGVNIPAGYGQLSTDITLVGDAQPMTTTWGFDFSEPIPDPSAIANTFFTLLTGTNRPFQLSTVASAVTIGPFRVTCQLASGPLSGVGTLFGVGTSASAMLPNNCATLVQKRTARGGKQGRGRAYIPPANLPEASVFGGGQLDGTFRSDQETRWNGFRTDAAANSLPLVLLHSDADLPDAITGLTVDGRIATQRTRMRP